MIGRIIETESCLFEGAEWLTSVDPRFGDVLTQAGSLPLRRKPEGFAELFNAIVSQQVSVASANAIWSRVEAAGFSREAAVLTASEDDLRQVGLSRPKVRYAKELAKAAIDYDALRALPDEDVIKTLVQVPGIGVWTAEIYAMFSLGRADIFAAGDLALQEAARVAFGLNDRPTEKQMRQLAKTWSPWRAVAARALWAYYRTIKSREGVT